VFKLAQSLTGGRASFRPGVFLRQARQHKGVRALNPVRRKPDAGPLPALEQVKERSE
jgi:hypothetical protein